MASFFSSHSLTIFSLLTLLAYSGCAGGEREWSAEETGHSKVEQLLKDFADESEGTTVKLKYKLVRLDGKAQPPPEANCREDECFKLYYFTGNNFDIRDGKRKNILYIPGGPGQIVTAGDRTRFLEKSNNVVYFHIRGAGLSQISPKASYDPFLRADLVVEDIEQLRTEILAVDGQEAKKWDAIYAFSYGTVIAQKYAHAHPDRVQRLILSAPIVRYRDTDKARSAKLRSNLEKIYQLIRSRDKTPCDCANRSLKVTVIGRGQKFENIEPTDNFCFLDTALSSLISDKVLEIYDKLIREYGAIGLVTANYHELKDDADFQKQFPYPKDFFVALRQLTLVGAPQTEESVLTSDSLRIMVDAAMVLGYYASFSQKELQQLRRGALPACRLDGSFFEHAPRLTCAPQASYCDRLKQAIDKYQDNDGTEFRRALYVFQLNDGMSHWLPRMIKENNIPYGIEACPTSEELKSFLSLGGKHKLIRDIGARIGMLPLAYCLWTPAKFRHSVPTLVVKGGADVVLAGCQAEEFFNTGLAKDSRVLIEFPTMGHMFDLRFVPLAGAGPTETGIAYNQLIDSFMRKSPDEFQNAPDTQERLKAIGATLRLPDSGNRLSCPDK